MRTRDLLLSAALCLAMATGVSATAAQAAGKDAEHMSIAAREVICMSHLANGQSFDALAAERGFSLSRKKKLGRRAFGQIYERKFGKLFGPTTLYVALDRGLGCVPVIEGNYQAETFWQALRAELNSSGMKPKREILSSRWMIEGAYQRSGQSYELIGDANDPARTITILARQ